MRSLSDFGPSYKIEKSGIDGNFYLVHSDVDLNNEETFKKVKKTELSECYCYIIRIKNRPELFGVCRSKNLLKYDGDNPYRHVG